MAIDFLLLAVVLLALATLLARHYPRSISVPVPPKNPCGFMPS